MDPVNDLDRELMAAMQVEPPAGLAARVRARIASETPAPRWQVPRLALVAGVFALAALAINVLSMRPGSIALGDASVLPNRHLALVVPLPPAPPSFASRVVHRPQPRSAPRVLVSQSEMLALRRLFSGDIVAPAAGVVADELSIPQLAIDAIALPAILEGDQQ
jgi:hypothetical protein